MIEILLINDQDASQNIVSNAVDLGEWRDFSFQGMFSGGGSDLDGAFLLSGSNVNVDAYFVDIPPSVTPIENSEGGLFPVSNGNYRYVKVKWTHTAGTGNLTVHFLLKQQGLHR